ncbi:alpha-1-macroglobulin isoform X1 [Nasonia vitripennis]|uniref:TEP1-F n=1 Tax=Nasonia vitripennis TaxID=7425 RepID=A0A7M7Q868_NASVI|nr:alpha-1-macroglobulin isoform X1 [Nasonia vitripennis]
MRRDLSIVLCLAALSCAAGLNRNRGYIFTAPKRLIAGETENVCLSLHNLESPVHVSVDLLATSSAAGPVTPASAGGALVEDDILGSAKNTLKSGVETCLELRVTSSTKYSAAKLRLRLKFDKHPDYVVDTEKKVFIEHDALVTFVETDKAIYKPGQDVNIRILTLRHDLKPWIKAIPKVWIENPSEVRVAQWTNVTTENGMAQLTFPLSTEPSSGIWRIKVEKNRPQLVHTSTFEVRKYVLPRFQVTIGAPSYILADAPNATWKVCVRYSYGEPVKGKLLLSLRPQTPIWKRKQTVADINYEETLDAKSDGCMNYTVSAQVLGLPHWKVAPNNVVLLANFTEAKSGVVETATSRSPVMHQPLKLEFSPHTLKYFKPGLPYHGKLRVLRADASSPAPNEKIQVCLRIRRKDEWQRSVVECRNFTSSNADGFLDFIVPPQNKNIVLLSFVATAVNYPTKYYSPDKRWRVFVDQPSAYIDVEPWYSPSSSYLSVTRGSQPLVCGEKYSFNVMYTSGTSSTVNATNLSPDDTEPISFHYSINSKGDLLVFGHVKYKPRKDTLLDYSEFRHVLGAGAGSKPNPSVHRFPLSVKITASMAPVSELLLYYVRPDGEVVTASHSIEVGHCFENKVKTAWQQEKQSPGSLAKFHVEATPLSLCGISAVDKSTRFLTQSQPVSSEGGSAASTGSNLLEPEATFARLKPFHLPPETMPMQSTWAHCDKSQGAEDSNSDEGPMEEIDHLPKPAARNKRHSVTYNVAANYVDAIQAFDDFGTIVMSDLILESRPCPPWRSSFGRVPLGPSSDEIDEPDRMLKAVKAMPLAFQFGAPGIPGPEASPMGQDVNYVNPTSMESQTSTIVRSYFPETWIWELVPTGKDGRATIERQLPDSITDWIGNTVCISSKSGLGIGNPVQITSFQPFFLDYSLPYSVKRGEQLRLKVSLFNYMQHSLPVLIKLLDHEGLDLGFNSSSEASYCLGPRDSIVHEFPLLPRELGEINVTVAAEVDKERAEACGAPTPLPDNRDEIIKPVLVKTEGFPVEISRSSFLCPRDFSDDTSLVWELELPRPEDEQVVEGSVSAYVSLIGDVLGPALENLEQLVRLPMGCGEQNMILFVPNIHAIAYLDAINRQTGSEMRARAIKNMQKGYQRELNYRHPDGSYSAFGAAADEAGSGSMWLTAFVVKSFAQARSIIQIDERDLKLSVKWIVRRQLENGCFPVVGQVFHKDMKGGLREEDGSSSALTAYVLIALLESGVPLSAALVNNALYCLEKASVSDHFADNPYTGALTTYALALLEHPRANESLRSLMGRASRQKDLLWWEDKSRPGSLALSIEMTSYGLLSLIKLGGENNTLEALRVVRWLSKKRNAEGGFSSTQDTVLGLEALTKYALKMANASATELSVLLTANDMEKLFKINDENRMLLNRVELPTLPTTLEIFAEGEGCLLVQSSLRYHKAKASGSEAFDLSTSTASVSTADQTPNDGCSIQRLTVCTRYKLPDEESNMAVLEIAMVSGFRPDRASLHDLLDEHATGVKRFEENDDTVAIYFDKLTAQKTCISFQAIRENVVDHAEPANIKLYDYYQQELTVSTSYAFMDVCEKNKTEKAVINHEANSPAPRKMQQLDNRLSVNQLPEKIDGIFEIDTTREKKVDPSIFKQRSSGVTIPATISIDLDEGSGIEPDGELFSPSPILPNIDQDVVDEGFSPAFINVDHELETPNGIEGPIPFYVEAPVSTTTKESVFAQTPLNAKPSLNFHNSTKVGLKTEETKMSRSLASCPRCEEGIPSDIKELYCSSASAVKVAIRRSRKARLLLDLSSSSASTRLRSTIELNIKPECPCAPLDKPGIMALLLSSKGGFNFAKSSDKSKALLDRSNSMFALTSVIGTPHEIQEAQLSCSRNP